MSCAHDNRTPATRATDERFLNVVMSVSEDYPEGTAFASADAPDLARFLARNLAERRTTVIVHDDGSEVVIDPPELGRAALLVAFILGSLILRDRARPKVEAGGQVVQLPIGARVRWQAAAAA